VIGKSMKLQRKIMQRNNEKTPRTLMYWRILTMLSCCWRSSANCDGSWHSATKTQQCNVNIYCINKKNTL